ncbi:hypothetical protein [Bacillus sp. FJAT-47783]|uniref:hypothetical protein n=1 Tax=Bacillus sp. FJAT-47783 TaxID=2922712 RepID=UPI001FAD8250|nr:hypothetical protein [Bacillus sp. FJAT-47783]
MFHQFSTEIGDSEDLLFNLSQASHDNYDVFVNGRFVGKKRLFSVHECIQDLADFLLREGFSQIRTSRRGHQYYIQSKIDDSHAIQALVYDYLRQ